MDDFSIRFGAEASVEMDAPCGRIVVGDWQETFGLAPLPGHPNPDASLEDLWRHQLTRLVNGVSAVVLPTQPGRGWVLYRERDEVYVQDQLFLVPDGEGEVVLDASAFAIRPRRTESEDGDEISEWATSIQAIRSFLE